MRALISGSSGFLGRALERALRSAGAVVHPIVRRQAALGEVEIDPSGRRLDTTGLPGGLGEVDVIFNLAGEPLTPRRWGPSKLERIRSSRILTTDLLARAIATSDTERPPVLVSMSAVGYYGSRGDETLTEDSAAGTGFLAETCRSWEAATTPAREAGGRVVTCRSGVILGAGGGALAQQRRIFSLGLGGRLGSGRQWTSWISLDDAVGALLFCAGEEGLSGAVNLCAPEPVRNAELTTTLAQLLHRPALLPVPRPLLRVVLGQRVTDEFLLASQRCLPGRLVASGYRFSSSGLADALAAALGEDRSSR